MNNQQFSFPMQQGIQPMQQGGVIQTPYDVDLAFRNGREQAMQEAKILIQQKDQQIQYLYQQMAAMKRQMNPNQQQNLFAGLNLTGAQNAIVINSADIATFEQSFNNFLTANLSVKYVPAGLNGLRQFYKDIGATIASTNNKSFVDLGNFIENPTGKRITDEKGNDGTTYIQNLITTTKNQIANLFLNHPEYAMILNEIQTKSVIEMPKQQPFLFSIPGPTR